MDPQFNNNEPALRLPQPVSDPVTWQAPANGGYEQAPNFELGAQQPQGVSMPPSIAPVQQSQQLQQTAPIAQPLNPSPSSTTTAHTTADEFNDDRVWIERAKRIVEQTHTDPYLESQEIGKFKAEYLKDVHAKNIKVAEG